MKVKSHYKKMKEEGRIEEIYIHQLKWLAKRLGYKLVKPRKPKTA